MLFRSLLNHPFPPGSSPSSLSSPSLPCRRFAADLDLDFLDLIERARRDVGAPEVLSGNSANEILFGVECPDDGLLSPNPNPIDPSAPPITASGTFNILPLGVCVTGVAGVDRTFILEYLGGEGGLVECLPFVNNREIEAVAVEVVATGSTVGGVRRDGRGMGGLRVEEEARDAGALSRMLRRDSRVLSTCKVLESDDSSDEAESSSIG